jgi:hypothetical protein
MSLPEVLDAVQSAIKGVQVDGSPFFRGVSQGPIDAVPDSPWAMLQLSTFTVPDQVGSDLEATDWNIDARIMVQYAPDHYVAETMLAAAIEPIRDVFRAHIKLGLPHVVRAKVASGSFAYVFYDSIAFRFVDLVIEVREKSPVRYAP